MSSRLSIWHWITNCCASLGNYFSCSQHPRVACSSLSGAEASRAFPLPTLARWLQLTLLHSSHSASHPENWLWMTPYHIFNWGQCIFLNDKQNGFESLGSNCTWVLCSKIVYPRLFICLQWSALFLIVVNLWASFQLTERGGRHISSIDCCFIPCCRSPVPDEGRVWRWVDARVAAEEESKTDIS